MGENIIAQKIRKKSAAKLLISIPFLLLDIFLVCMFYQGGLFSLDGFFSPVPIKTLDDLNRVTRVPLAANFIRVSLMAAPDYFLEAGVQQTEDDVPVGEFMAVYVEGKYVLCYISEREYQSLSDGSVHTFTGVLVMPENEVISLTVDGMKEAGYGETEARGILYPYSIDTTKNGVFGRVMMYLFVLALLIAGMLAFITGLAPLLNIAAYRPVKKLAQYGPIDAMLAEIDCQMLDGGSGAAHMLGKYNQVYLLRDWIVVETNVTLRFQRSHDLLWAYKERRTTKYYGVVTMNVNTFIKLNGLNQSISLLGYEQGVDDTLAAIQREYPWSIVGYSDHLAAIWSRDRNQFVRYAEEKRSGTGNQADGQQAEPSAEEQAQEPASGIPM